MMVYWRIGSIAPLIFYLGTRWRWVASFTSRPLYPRERAPGTRWIGGWVDPTACLDATSNLSEDSQTRALWGHWQWKICGKVAISPTEDALSVCTVFISSILLKIHCLCAQYLSVRSYWRCTICVHSIYQLDPTEDALSVCTVFISSILLKMHCLCAQYLSDLAVELYLQARKFFGGCYNRKTNCNTYVDVNKGID
jgi:hypothetical protein